MVLLYQYAGGQVSQVSDERGNLIWRGYQTRVSDGQPVDVQGRTLQEALNNIPANRTITPSSNLSQPINNGYTPPTVQIPETPKKVTPTTPKPKINLITTTTNKVKDLAEKYGIKKKEYEFTSGTTNLGTVELYDLNTIPSEQQTGNLGLDWSRINTPPINNPQHITPKTKTEYASGQITSFKDWANQTFKPLITSPKKSDTTTKDKKLPPSSPSLSEGLNPFTPENQLDFRPETFLGGFGSENPITITKKEPVPEEHPILDVMNYPFEFIQKEVDLRFPNTTLKSVVGGTPFTSTPITTSEGYTTYFSPEGDIKTKPFKTTRELTIGEGVSGGASVASMFIPIPLKFGGFGRTTKLKTTSFVDVKQMGNSLVGKSVSTVTKKNWFGTDVKVGDIETGVNLNPTLEATPKIPSFKGSVYGNIKTPPGVVEKIKSKVLGKTPAPKVTRFVGETSVSSKTVPLVEKGGVDAIFGVPKIQRGFNVEKPFERLTGSTASSKVYSVGSFKATLFKGKNKVVGRIASDLLGSDVMNVRNIKGSNQFYVSSESKVFGWGKTPVVPMQKIGLRIESNVVRSFTGKTMKKIKVKKSYGKLKSESVDESKVDLDLNKKYPVVKGAGVSVVKPVEDFGHGKAFDDVVKSVFGKSSVEVEGTTIGRFGVYKDINKGVKTEKKDAKTWETKPFEWSGKKDVLVPETKKVTLQQKNVAEGVTANIKEVNEGVAKEVFGKSNVYAPTPIVFASSSSFTPKTTNKKQSSPLGRSVFEGLPTKNIFEGEPLGMSRFEKAPVGKNIFEDFMKPQKNIPANIGGDVKIKVPSIETTKIDYGMSKIYTTTTPFVSTIQIPKNIMGAKQPSKTTQTPKTTIDYLFGQTPKEKQEQRQEQKQQQKQEQKQQQRQRQEQKQEQKQKQQQKQEQKQQQKQIQDLFRPPSFRGGKGGFAFVVPPVIFDANIKPTKKKKKRRHTTKFTLF